MARGIIGAPRRVNYRGTRRATTMSASPPKATNERTFRNRRSGPQRDSCTATRTVLFDHFVRDGDERRRNRQPESFGRF